MFFDIGWFWGRYGLAYCPLLKRRFTKTKIKSMKEHRDTDIRICALIALSFFWTGCGYLSWFYHLTDFYSASMADMLSEVVGYLFQALGLAMFALFKRRPASQEVKTEQFALISGAGLLLDLLASLSPSGPVSLVFG